jgi:hypothetical protein
MYISTLSLTSALDAGWVVNATPRRGRFNPWRETWYPLYSRLGGPSLPPGLYHRTLLPVASRYTDWAIPVCRRTNSNIGVCGVAVGWGTELQAGRSRVRFTMVSLEFFIDIILPAALWPLVSTQPLTEMSTRNIYHRWGVKAAAA